MVFRDHHNLDGMHAFLGASKYHWIGYDDEKMIQSYHNMNAAKIGTELHEFAAQCIRLGQRLPKSKKTLNAYVNDAIGFRMKPEQVLFYSDNCFGTADAISFNNDVLRIHDLKTGSKPASMKQLEVYAALFCLEYSKKPSSMKMELRMYQDDDVLQHSPEPEDIVYIMDKIVHFDKLINDIRREEG